MEVFIMNMQYDWNKPDTIRTFVEEIQTRAIEDYDKFIFETIKPYCEHITQQTISKEYLENALLHYRDLEQENEKLKDAIREAIKNLEDAMASYKQLYKEYEELKAATQEIHWEEF